MTGPLYDYVLDTIQDEEWLILDKAFPDNPNGFLSPAGMDTPDGWIDRIIGKMINTYKEIT